MRSSLQPADTPEDLCRILPHPAADCSGRPVTVVRACDFAAMSNSDNARRTLLRTAETLRLHVLYTNLTDPSKAGQGKGPILQVVTILDVADTPIHSFVWLLIHSSSVTSAHSN
jgi:hypothetical protein